MSKLDVLCRYKKNKTASSESDKNYLESLRIIQNKDSIEEVEIEGEDDDDKFEYGAMTMDTNDVKAFNYVDEDHTCLRFHNGESFVIKFPYDGFQDMYEEITGQFVRFLRSEEKSDA